MGSAGPHTPLLDITRFLSRADGVLTGIDRVEFAYLRRFQQHPDPAFALARTTLGYLLLDQDGMAALIEATQTGRWPVADWMSRWNTRLARGPKQVRSLARAVAVDRAPKWGLQRMIGGRIKGPIVYYNVGHSNLGERTFTPLKRLGAQSVVMVHDVIPLDHPEYQRPGATQAFAAKMEHVSAQADLVICLTKTAEAAVRRQLAAIGRVPRTVVAPLGVEPPQPVGEPWFGLGLTKGQYFICVGTIEPRKNHALLLDIWEKADGALPPLVLCGNRGWANEAVLERLDRGVTGVKVVHDLSDQSLAAMVSGARALLFPSFVEGFGLPPVEAAALGVPVIASDLPVLRETLSGYATFVSPLDSAAWAAEIARIVKSRPRLNKFQPPDWESHFKVALSMTC